VELRPEVLADNILFHDGNDRSVERLLQRVTENVYAFRAASQLLRGQFETINAAIRERP
jgi:flagellar basal body rod protein FlgB